MLKFLGKYNEMGLLLLRVSLGVLFLYLTVPVLTSGARAIAHFGSGIRVLGLHSHFQLWGTVGALTVCVGAILMIFGLFFRIGILLVLVVTLLHVAGAKNFHSVIPAIEMAIVLVSLLLIGPGKFSVDKT